MPSRESIIRLTPEKSPWAILFAISNPVFYTSEKYQKAQDAHESATKSRHEFQLLTQRLIIFCNTVYMKENKPSTMNQYKVPLKSL